jgi:hypothetical protein
MDDSTRKYCIQSELEYSCALGGEVEVFGACLAVINTTDKVLGDYNRIFVREESTLEVFIEEIRNTKERFAELGIPSFSRVETFPCIRQEFTEVLTRAGLNSIENTYFALEHVEKIESDRGIVGVPSHVEYLDWYEQKCRGYSDFDEGWWREERINRIPFIDIFRPHWLFIDGVHVGYMYCAELKGFTCIHDVNIYPEHRKKGYGLEMNNKVIRDKERPVVGRISRSVGSFYANLGFEFACATRFVDVEGV